MKNYKLKILPSAKKDWQEARIWYKQQNSNLPTRFNEQIKATAIQICKLPFSHAVRYKNVRIANTRIFPYAVHYLVEEETIIIIAIHHTAINPAKWKARLRS